MSRNRLYRTYRGDAGEPLPVEINRRGCKGPWTKKDDEMMRQLARAVLRRERERAAEGATLSESEGAQ